jgi:hypothetical protein
MLPRSRSAVLPVVVAFLVASCASGDDRPFGPTSDVAAPTAPTTASGSSHSGLSARGLFGGDSLTLFACAADSVADSSSATIGPLGGTIQFGPNTLVVPPGALLKATTITATMPADGHVSAVFQPEGLQFLVPPQLTLSYAQCSPAPIHPASIAYLQSLLGGILQLLPSQDNPTAGHVVAPIWHFSVYAVAD